MKRCRKKKKDRNPKKQKPLTDKDYAILMGVNQPKYYRSRGYLRQR